VVQLVLNWETELFYRLVEFSWESDAYVASADPNDWSHWLSASIPSELDPDVRKRLTSNLKHIITGLEMKAGLIVPHGMRGRNPSVVFESYFQSLIFEFCVGVFSVCEGIGAAYWFKAQGTDGADGQGVDVDVWLPELVGVFDPGQVFGLGDKIRTVKEVRDLMHQDRLGARSDIDWHSCEYENAFLPARDALRCLLRLNPDRIPEKTNLNDDGKSFGLVDSQ